uniref:Uncharacterized protein n=1 Tax=Cacopsylla melanoneura TaxID=428564 RepID=A0A8D8YC25_9HEMI
MLLIFPHHHPLLPQAKGFPSLSHIHQVQRFSIPLLSCLHLLKTQMKLMSNRSWSQWKLIGPVPRTLSPLPALPLAPRQAPSVGLTVRSSTLESGCTPTWCS